MEVPINLAIDTTENWRRSDTVLGNSELAIEIHTLPDGKEVKHLLVGDGKRVGPDVERLRAKPDFIASLPDYIAQAVSAEARARDDADRNLKEAISLLAPAGLENLPDLLASKAPADSPVFIGVVKVPEKTGAAGDDGTLAATEAQVYLANKALNARIDSVENLGHYAGAFDARALLPTNKSDFPQGITVNDFATIRADETHGGATTGYVASTIGDETGVITWDYDVTYSKADFATAAQGAKADSAVQPAVVNKGSYAVGATLMASGYYTFLGIGASVLVKGQPLCNASGQLLGYYLNLNSGVLSITGNWVFCGGSLNSGICLVRRVS